MIARQSSVETAKWHAGSDPEAKRRHVERAVAKTLGYVPGNDVGQGRAAYVAEVRPAKRRCYLVERRCYEKQSDVKNSVYCVGARRFSPTPTAVMTRRNSSASTPPLL